MTQTGKSGNVHRWPYDIPKEKIIRLLPSQKRQDRAPVKSHHSACEKRREELDALYHGSRQEFRIHRYGQLNDIISCFLWCLDVTIKKTLKTHHETSRKLKQRTKTRYDEKHTALYLKEGCYAYFELHDPRHHSGGALPTRIIVNDSVDSANGSNLD